MNTSWFTKGLYLILVFFAGVGLFSMISRGTAVLGDSSSQIHACVKNNPEGNVRIVSDAQSCKNDESPLAWNIQGPPGPAATGNVATFTATDFSDISPPDSGNWTTVGQVSITIPGTSNHTVLLNGLFREDNASQARLLIDGVASTWYGEELTEGGKAVFINNKLDVIGAIPLMQAIVLGPGTHTIQAQFTAASTILGSSLPHMLISSREMVAVDLGPVH